MLKKLWSWLRPLLLPLLLASSPSEAGQSYCYWIRLDGLYIEQSPDFLTGGDYLPLIGLEAGELYSLLSGSEKSIELPSKTEQKIDGHWYYLPPHLIDRSVLTLNVMVMDRDEDTDDDLVLPLRRHAIRLDQGFSPSGRKQIEIPELYILDDQMTKSNAVRFRFELRRAPGPCGSGSPEGMAADSANRKENRVHHLRSRIFRYFEEPVLAGREAKLFVVQETPDAASAYQVARRNLHELLALGREVERLKGARGFEELRYELGRLIARLREKRVAFTLIEEHDGKRRKVRASAPALASEPEWRKYLPDADLEPIPEGWLLP